MSVVQIMEQVAAFSSKHVVLTGGEPMIHRSVVALAEAIRQAGYHLTIETAGTVWHELDCDLWSISPKLSQSAPSPDAGTWREVHHERRHRPDVVRRMMQSAYQLKFVVDSPKDAQEILDYLAALGDYDSSRVLMMPQGTDIETLNQHAQWLEPWCKEQGVQFCPRQHIYWFGNRRAT